MHVVSSHQISDIFQKLVFGSDRFGAFKPRILFFASSKEHLFTQKTWLTVKNSHIQTRKTSSCFHSVSKHTVTRSWDRNLSPNNKNQTSSVFRTHLAPWIESTVQNVWSYIPVAMVTETKMSDSGVTRLGRNRSVDQCTLEKDGRHWQLTFESLLFAFVWRLGNPNNSSYFLYKKLLFNNNNNGLKLIVLID